MSAQARFGWWSATLVPLGLVYAIVVGTTVSFGGGAAQTGHDERRPRVFDAASTALSSPARPDAADDTLEVDAAGGGIVEVDTAATATPTCRGCSGTAATIHVVNLWRPGETRLANIATAATPGCRRCWSVAISVQVVVARRPGPLLEAENMALALSPACRRCASAALAYQLVVAADGVAWFSPKARAELARWVREQLNELAAATSAAAGDSKAPGRERREARTRLNQATQAVSHLVARELGGEVLAENVDTAGPAS